MLHMPEWIHKTTTCKDGRHSSDNFNEVEDHIEAEGQDNWELVTVLSAPYQELRFFWKKLSERPGELQRYRGNAYE